MKVAINQETPYLYRIVTTFTDLLRKTKCVLLDNSARTLNSVQFVADPSGFFLGSTYYGHYIISAIACYYPAWPRFSYTPSFQLVVSIQKRVPVGGYHEGP